MHILVIGDAEQNKDLVSRARSCGFSTETGSEVPAVSSAEIALCSYGGVDDARLRSDHDKLLACGMRRLIIHIKDGVQYLDRIQNIYDMLHNSRLDWTVVLTNKESELGGKNSKNVAKYLLDQLFETTNLQQVVLAH